MIEGAAPHVPVLIDEVVAALAPTPGALFVDATFGAGGYTRALLRADASVIAIDRDPDAIAAGRERLGAHQDRKDVPFRQVLASVGQTHLMHTYDRLFAKTRFCCGAKSVTNSTTRSR